MLLRILDEEVCVAVDGRKRRMTRREASLRALIDQATAGDMRAARMLQQREAQALMARDAAEAGNGGVDTSALTLGIAEALRKSNLTCDDTSRQDARTDEVPARDDKDKRGDPGPLTSAAREADEARPDCADDEPVCGAEDGREEPAGEEEPAEDRGARDSQGDQLRAAPFDTTPRGAPPLERQSGLVFGNAPTGACPPRVRHTVPRAVISREPLIKDPRHNRRP
jgi:hypothetical protein